MSGKRRREVPDVAADDVPRRDVVFAPARRHGAARGAGTRTAAGLWFMSWLAAALADGLAPALGCGARRREVRAEGPTRCTAGRGTGRQPGGRDEAAAGQRGVAQEPAP